MTRRRTLLFARVPEAGRAKTRLIPALGPEGAASLHGALLRHALDAAAASRQDALELWLTGDDPGGLLAGQARARGAAVRWQPEGDLGARMFHALACATREGDQAIVMGTDCPALGPAELDEAHEALRMHDAVIGPATDGGYVLLGMRAPRWAVFDGVPWGTSRVLEETRARMRTLGWHWHELDPRDDIDRPEDLPGLEALGGHWAAWAAPGSG